MDYWKRFWTVVWADFKKSTRSLLVGLLLAIAILVFQILYGVISHAQERGAYWSITWPYLAVFAIYLMINGFRAVPKLDSDLRKEIALLQTHLAAHVVVTGLDKSDPKLEAEFLDERALGDKTSSLLLTNRGSGTAYMVRIFPLKLKERTLGFPQFVEILEASNSARFEPFVGEQWGYDSHHDFVRALSEEWVTRGDCKHVREVIVPARIDYEDAEGNRFEADFELLYHGGQGYNHPEKHNCIECRNFLYRRIPVGLTSEPASSDLAIGAIS
jgi:hypothetical protein